MDERVKRKNTTLRVIADSCVNKDIKLFYIMSLLNEEAINLGKAYDLCVECDIFKQRWPMIEYEASEVYKRYYILEGTGIEY